MCLEMFSKAVALVTELSSPGNWFHACGPASFCIGVVCSLISGGY